MMCLPGCIYFYGMYMLGGDIMFLFLLLLFLLFIIFISFIVSCFTCATLIIDLYYEVIHDMSFIFYFVKSRIYFFLVFFTHAFMCLLSVTGIYKLIQSCCCLHWQLIDGS